MLREPVFWYGMCFIMCALTARALQKLAWQRYLHAIDATDCGKPVPPQCDVGINLAREGFWSLVSRSAALWGP